MEAKIAKLEKEIKEIDVELSINYEATIAQSDFFDTYQGKKDELESLMSQWEIVSEELDSIL